MDEEPGDLWEAGYTAIPGFTVLSSAVGSNKELWGCVAELEQAA